MAELRLTTHGPVTATSWRWLLCDPTGKPLADHEVRLDRDTFEFAGFVDLYQFVWRHADPVRRGQSELALIDRVGRWIATEVLGPAIVGQIVKRAPVSVRVVVPADATFLLHRPLELAIVNDAPLVEQDVSLIFELEGEELAEKQPVQERLRLLAVFSMPRDFSVLALRRERHRLVRLLGQLRARSGKAITMRVLQYGVTRERLLAATEDGEGWDVIHVSGHGLADGLLLEHADGSADLVATPDLVDLLAPAKERVKLVVLSSCQSGAATAAQTLYWLDLPEVAGRADQYARLDGGGSPAALPGLAGKVVDDLGAAVVAMRFPVRDDFASAFADELYTRLFERGQRLASAARLSLRPAARAVGLPPRALSIGTPALFGTRAAELQVTPPDAAQAYDGGAERLSGFPVEPPRFVGRAEAMARASAALAPDSGTAAVLFHGMAGGGKTTCALELSYGHADTFAAGVAFWRAPDSPEEAFDAIDQLARSLEIQLGPHLGLISAVSSVDSLQQAAPRITRSLEANGFLIVLDNLETLLDARGEWRDPRCAVLVNALVSHTGFSRAIFTSRVRPGGLDGVGVEVLPVHALSLAEAALLARELPNLGRLLHADAERADDGAVAPDRLLVRAVLEVVQGHPKLLELADADARDPDRLRARIAAAKAAADGDTGDLQAFLRTGTTRLGADELMNALRRWTVDAARQLSPAARLLLQFLCCIEDADRTSWTIDANWEDLWNRLDLTGDPPQVEPLLAELRGAALLTAFDQNEDLIGYEIHPGVSEAVRDETDAEVRKSAEIEMARFWSSVQEQVSEAGDHGMATVAAALSSAVYFIRLEHHANARWMLQQAMRTRDPAVARRVVSLIRRLPDDGDGVQAALLADALTSLDPDEAEARLKEVAEQARADGNVRLLTSVLGTLVIHVGREGRLDEALELSNQKTEISVQAGHGPWTQLAHARDSLWIRLRKGEAEFVLAEAERLLEEMTSLERSSQSGTELVAPWNVEEAVLSLGRDAAIDLDNWSRALELNADLLDRKRARGAGSYELAYAAYNDYGPLVRLGRPDEADRLLDSCQEAFARANDIARLANVYTARAEVASARRDPAAAADLERTALRFHYAAGTLTAIWTSHNNLGNYSRYSGDWQSAFDNHAAAAALELGASGQVDRLIAQNLKVDLHDERGLADQDTSGICERIESDSGVSLRALLERLGLDEAGREATFARALDQARAATVQLPKAWEQTVDAVVEAARRGVTSEALDHLLTELGRTDDWRAVCAALRRVISGERDTSTLSADLDAVDLAVLTSVIERLEDRSD